MIIDTNDLISLVNYAKTQNVSRQRINQIKNNLPIVLIDNQPFIDKSKLNTVLSSDTKNIIVDYKENRETKREIEGERGENPEGGEAVFLDY